MENKIHVAIIDDGVNTDVFYNVNHLINNIEITDELNVIQVSDSIKYNMSHGTICAEIVKQYAPNIVMSSVKILHNMRSTKEKLVTAIEWCLKNNIDIINLSLGTEDYRDYSVIRSIVNYSYSKGIIIIAAFSNNGVITYPASLSNVIGVKCNTKKNNDTGEIFYRYYAMDMIDIMTCGIRCLIDKYHTIIPIPLTNSYATPLVTALVSKIICKYRIKNIEFIRKKLEDYSKRKNENFYYNPFFYNTIDWVNKSIMFEIGELNQQSYSEYLNIEKIFYVNKEEELFNTVKQYLYLYEKMLNYIDTIILNVSKKYYQKIDIQRLIEYLSGIGKNIVYLNDNYQKDNFNINKIEISSKIYHPIIHECWNNKEFDKKDDIEIPIILVYNHSKHNICNILQMLQDFFRNDGYHSITITQTCKGLLYNLKYISSNVLYTAGSVNKNLLKYLEKMYNTDVIIIEANKHDNVIWDSVECDIILDVYSRIIRFNMITFSQDDIQNLYKHIFEILK